MSKDKQGKSGKSKNNQKKLNDVANPTSGKNRNQNHNSKKQALGPNTSR